jgi:hypothetical protein
VLCQVIEGWEASLLLAIYGLYLVVTVTAPAIRLRFNEWYWGTTRGAEKSFVERRREELAAERAAEGGDDYGEQADAREEDARPRWEWPEGGRPWVGYDWATLPLRLAFIYTCPDCTEGRPTEKLYPVTLLVAFLWISLFSFIISEVVSAWEVTRPRPFCARRRIPVVWLRGRAGGGLAGEPRGLDRHPR